MCRLLTLLTADPNGYLSRREASYTSTRTRKDAFEEIGLGFQSL